MPLWDDATAPYTGQGPQQDNSGLWGWLTSLFSPRSAATTPAAPTTPSPNLTPEQIRAAAGLPTWGGMSGIPASMQIAPPSMYTAGNPQQQAAWQQASTPEGYAAALAAARGAPAAATPSVLRPPPAAMMPPPPKPMPALQAPVITGPSNYPPGNYSAPVGNTTGWAGYGPGRPPPPGYGPTVPPPSPASAAPPSSSAGIPLTDTKSRNLSDAELAKMTNVDIARAAARTDLTYGDRMAILARLGR